MRRLTAMLAIMFCCAAARADTVRMGAILPLTGPVASIGMQQMRGIRLAIDEVNGKGGLHGHTIEAVFEDNQAKPDLSIRCFNRLTELQHLQIVFTAYSGPTLAIAPLATRNQVLLINAGAQADRLATASRYLFNTLPPVSAEIAILTKLLARMGKSRAAILYQNDPDGISGRDDFVDAFPGKIVAQEAMQFGQTDFRNALSRLAAAQPDVMLISSNSGLQAIARQHRQAGLNVTVAGTTFLQDPDLLKDPASNGFVHTQIRIEAPPELARAFEQKYGAEMEFHARQYYNAARIVLTAVDRLLADGKPVTGEAMRKTMLQIRTFSGLVQLEFNSNTAAMPIDIVRILDGKDRNITD